MPRRATQRTQTPAYAHRHTHFTFARLHSVSLKARRVDESTSWLPFAVISRRPLFPRLPQDIDMEQQTNSKYPSQSAYGRTYLIHLFTPSTAGQMAGSSIIFPPYPRDPKRDHPHTHQRQDRHTTCPRPSPSRVNRERREQADGLSPLCCTVPTN